MSRPRRSLPMKSYAVSSSEDESEAEMGGSGFDSLSEDSALNDASNKELSDFEDSDTSDNEDTLELSPTSSLFPAILTSSQISQTRAIMVEQAADVVDLQAKHELHMKLAGEYKTKLEQAQNALAESAAKIAPISRVPPEVLGFIFTIHVHENRQSPWLLMKVTRVWRATSLLTRKLWRGIMLVPKDWSIPWIRRYTRSVDGLQVCTNEVQLRSALARAGSLPLDLRVSCVPVLEGSQPSSPTTVTRDKASLCDLLERLSSHPGPLRIRSLDIASADEFKLPANAFDGLSFADMESLTMDSNYPLIALKMVKESTRVRALNIPTTSLKDLQKLQWQEIDHFTLSHACGDTEFNIRPILEVMNALTYLDVCGDAVKSAENGGDVKLKMSSLKRLSMRHSGTFWPIQCTNLTHLTLELCEGMEAPEDHSIPLLYLVKLTFITGDNSVGALRAFKMPLLQKLSLAHSHGKIISAKGMKELWPIQAGVPAGRRVTPADVEPFVLELHGFPVNPRLLARTLNERLSLEKLKTDGLLVNAEFFDILAPVRITKGKGPKADGKGTVKGEKAPGSKRGWSVGCPELKKLVIDLRSQRRIKPEEVADIRKSAKNFAAERLKVDAPLEQLAICFDKCGHWEELVESRASLRGTSYSTS